MAQAQQGMNDLPQRLAAEARGRYVRWSPALWQELLAGPAAEYANALHAAGLSAEGEALLTSYLTLARDGIGLGYLAPTASGARNFFTVAFGEILPRKLAGLKPARQAELLAACWNLGENLESQAAWLDRVFAAELRELPSLDQLESMVERVSTGMQQAPDQRLNRDWPVAMIDLAAVDSRFLPGAVRFLTPTVVCVYDRARSGAGGEVPTLGVWLRPQPVILGPMAIDEPPPKPADEPLWKRVNERDPRLSARFAAAANDWRAACTLNTSQCLFALLPGEQP